MKKKFAVVALVAASLFGFATASASAAQDDDQSLRFQITRIDWM
ncbi:hypothetical protein [Aeromicrobium sp. 179-A 4D2 NHS]